LVKRGEAENGRKKRGLSSLEDSIKREGWRGSGKKEKGKRGWGIKNFHTKGSRTWNARC